MDSFSDGDGAATLQRSVLASDLLSRKAEQVLVLRRRQVLADMYIVVWCDVVIVGRKVSVCGFLLSDCHVSAMNGGKLECECSRLWVDEEVKEMVILYWLDFNWAPVKLCMSKCCDEQ